MKILLINDFGTLQGGAEAQITALRDGLRQRGHEVLLLTSNARYGDLPLVSDYQCFGSTGAVRSLSQVANLSAAGVVQKLLREFQPDVVHARLVMWQLSPYVFSKLKNVPTIFNPADYKTACPKAKKILPDGRPCHHRAGRACLRHGCFSNPAQWGLEMLQLRVWRRYRHHIDRVVAQSEGSKVFLEKNGLAVDHVIHNGVLPSSGSAPLAQRPTVLFAGRLSFEKGLDVLLPAFARARQKCPDARLVIAGSGPEEANLRTQATALGLAEAVEMKGHLDKAALNREMSRAWLLAVPSTWHEPFPNVASEAMRQATPVVASKLGGLVDIVEEGKTGLLVPPRNDRALASALEVILANRERAEHLGRAAQRRVNERFGMERMAAEFEAVYLNLLKEKSQLLARRRKMVGIDEV